jgi:phage-related protein
MLSGSLARKINRRTRRKPKGWRPPPLSVEQILVWADEHHARTGRWPNVNSGFVRDDVEGTRWKSLDNALRQGTRGLPAGGSLAKLLQERRGVRNIRDLPQLSVEEILRWADAYHAARGEWPTPHSGSIPENASDNWKSIEIALRNGIRGLAKSSLARLLAEHRGRRNRKGLPPYTEEQILQWADRWHAERGTWPSQHSGPIPYVDHETWSGVNGALSTGIRGLPGGDSLPALLVRRRGARSIRYVADLDLEQIRAWATAFRNAQGRWPKATDGVIADSDGSTWQAVDLALRRGARGLPGGSSLAKLLGSGRARPPRK